ncbi:MAG: hypothetical protein AABY87_01365 [bacterium]
MHELVSVIKIVIYSLLMVSIILIMTVALLSILSDDMVFSQETIEIRQGKLLNIMLKLCLCGVTMVGYVVMMIEIR